MLANQGPCYNFCLSNFHFSFFCNIPSNSPLRDNDSPYTYANRTVNQSDFPSFGQGNHMTLPRPIRPFLPEISLSYKALQKYGEMVNMI